MIVYLLCATVTLLSIVDVSRCSQCSIADNNFRLDCYPQPGAEEAKCLARGCCWSVQSQKLSANDNVPSCFYPTDYANYQISALKVTPGGQQATLRRASPSYLPNEVPTLLLVVTHETPQRVRIRITDPNTARFEVPIELNPPDSAAPLNPEYQVIVPGNGSFSLEVKRNADGVSMFQAFGPLLFSDQFIQIASLMSVDQLYGIGEQNRPFLHRLSDGWFRLGLWARDHVIETDVNLYGTHPVYMGMPANGKAFGTFFLNSNAQEFGLQPAPIVTYRTTGGILDIFLFTGGTPEATVAQYVGLVGRPMFPPFWSLGFHLCRYGYKNLDHIYDVFRRNVDAGIPIAAQWADIDYMDKYRDFTLDPVNFNGTGDFVTFLRQSYGTRFVVILDPAISSQSEHYRPYDDGVAMNVFVRYGSSNESLEGVVWPGVTVFPDFTHPNATAYWTTQVRRLYSLADVDGLWIDMNEPSNMVAGSVIGCSSDSPYDNPFFVPEIRDGSLIAGTICPSALHYRNVPHYDLHNLYGFTQSVVTNAALRTVRPNQRPFILSRSTFSGSGNVTNHWTGDNLSKWDQLQHSIRQILNFNMFGVPMVGADICGFIGAATEELCVRWTQLGAFYPFMRNHNDRDSDRDQDPAAWSPPALQIMRESIRMRYSLIPYFYTLFSKANQFGSTVFRPLAFEFYSDPRTHGIDLQFMIGPSLLVTPVVTQGATSVTAYVPSGTWYDFFTGELLRSNTTGGNLVLDAPIDKINVALRGGHVVPVFDPTMTTDALRNSNVTLYCAMSAALTAVGDFYWDDGVSADTSRFTNVIFEADSVGFTSRPRERFYEPLPVLKRVIVVGLSKPSISDVRINGKSVPFSFEADSQLLFIDNLRESMSEYIYVAWR